jgi:hypothetical protein
LKSDLEAEGGGPIGVVDGMGSSGRLSGVEGGSEGSDGTAKDMVAVDLDGKRAKEVRWSGIRRR